MPVSSALENVRRLVAWSRRDRPAASCPRGLETVGILGAGHMGRSIAAAHVQRGLPVVVHDVDAEVLSGASAMIADAVRDYEESSPELCDRLMRPTAVLSDVAQCDLVIESIVEVASAKTQLYAQLQPHLAPQTIVASNTSTIPLERLACMLSDPSRFCGLHFCHPVWKRPLVEIVRGGHTSEATIADAVAHVNRLDRIPIVVPDGPGFVVNRLLFPYLGAGLELLQAGVAADAIEQAAADFGMAIGPLRLMDEIGLDTTLHAAWVLAAAFPDRILSSPLLVAMVKARRFGHKAGAGFFQYDRPNGDRIQGDCSPAASILAPWIDSPSKGPCEPTGDRLVLPMLLEATRILEEGMAGDVRDIDLAVLFGLGFPTEKGGLLWWADTLGAEQVIARLDSLDDSDARTEPTPMLQTLARSGGTFYRD